MSGFGSLWVNNASLVVGNSARSQIYPAVSQIDPRTRRVTTEPFSGTPATGFGSLWIQTNAASDDYPPSIVRVDPATGRTLARIDVPRVVGISFGHVRVTIQRDPEDFAAMGWFSEYLK